MSKIPVGIPTLKPTTMLSLSEVDVLPVGDARSVEPVEVVVVVEEEGEDNGVVADPVVAEVDAVLVEGVARQKPTEAGVTEDMEKYDLELQQLVGSGPQQ